MKTVTDDTTRMARNRPAMNPGGMVCVNCDEVFIGEEWHARCGICEATRLEKETLLNAKAGATR